MRTVIAAKIGKLCRAFTLVELLVVVAIVGVLTGLLVVGIGRARELAIHSASIGNLRGTLNFVILYTQDHKGQLPYGEDLGTYSFFNRAQMAPYLAGNDPAWFDPITTAYYKSQGGYTTATATWMGRIRTSWELTGGGATWYTQTGRPNPFFANKGILITSFVRPSESLILFNGGSSDQAGYNNGSASVGFADGSVRSVPDQSYKTGNVNTVPSVYQTYFALSSRGIRGYDY